MRTENDRFTILNTKASKEPRFSIALSFDAADTDVLWLTSHSSGKYPSGADNITDCIRNIASITQSIDPRAARATIGSLSFDVVDPASALTSHINTKLDGGDGLREKRVQVWLAFDNLAWTDYALRYTYLVDSVSFKDGVYSFRCSDIQRQARKEIFERHKTTLAVSITDTQTHIPCSVANATDYFPIFAHDASYTDAPSTTCSYIALEDEIIRVGSHPTLGNGTTSIYTHATDGLSFHVLERGALNTKAFAHDVDASASADRRTKIEEFIYLEGPAPKVVYALLTGDLYGQGSETLPMHWHLGIDSGYVTLSDFTGIGPDLWDSTANTGRMVRFEGLKKTDGKRFIEEELLLWLSCFSPVYANGQLGLRRLAPVLHTSSYVALLNQYDVIAHGELKHDMPAVVNQIIINWNYSVSQDAFLKRTVLVDATSQAMHGKAEPLTLDFRGVSTNAHTDADLFNYFNSLRDSYAGPPIRTHVELLSRYNVLEVGDTVKLDLPQLRDYVSGGSVNRVFQINRVSTNWITGRVRLDLFGSSQSAGTMSYIDANSVLDDGFYTASGTDISSLPEFSGGTLTGPVTLTGNTDMTASGAIYYYTGDLTIVNTVTVTNNVQLRIRGALSFGANGKIDGKGQGCAAGVGGSLFDGGVTQKLYTKYEDVDTNHTNGELGFLHGSAAQGAMLNYGFPPTIDPDDPWDDPATSKVYYNSYWAEVAKEEHEYVVRGGHAALEYPTLVNNGTTLQGLPTELRGSGGPGGGAVIDQFTGKNSYIKASGGNGGKGGAGLIIIVRGTISFGATGEIDLSGDDGAQGGSWNVNGMDKYAYGGAGGGGMAGCLMVLVDGNYTAPLLDDVTVNRGNCPQQGNPGVYRRNGWWSWKQPDDTRSIWDWYSNAPVSSGIQGAAAQDLGDAAKRFFYIPANESIEAELAAPTHQITALTALTISPGSVEPALPAHAGAVFREAVCTWSISSDPDATGYEIQYKRASESDWRPAAIERDENTPYSAFIVETGIDYDIRIRVLSEQGKDGHSDWYQTTFNLTKPSVTVPWDEFVSGTTDAPQDNATVGATWNDNITAQPSDAILRNQLLDPTSWYLQNPVTVNPSGFNHLDVVTENQNRIVSGEGPHGGEMMLWEIAPGESNSAAGWDGTTFEIDNTKDYRWSVFFRRTHVGSVAQGYFYLGLHGYNSAESTSDEVIKLLNGFQEPNPYFPVSYIPPRPNVWYLAVGYCMSKDHSGTTGFGGVWDCETGERVKANTSEHTYKWTSDAAKAHHRCYLYYVTNNVAGAMRQWMTAPRVDLLNGAEPSIEELLQSARLANDTALRLGNIFSETFQRYASGADLDRHWETINRVGENSIVTSGGVSGGKFLRSGNNSGNDEHWMLHRSNLPFDPNALYRMKVRARRTAGSANIWFGWAGFKDDLVTQCGSTGGPNYWDVHWHGGSVAPGASWTEFEGYTLGFGASQGTADIGYQHAPGTMHPLVRYIRPIIMHGYPGHSGTMDFDSVIVDVIPHNYHGHQVIENTITGTEIGPNAIATAHIVDAQITKAKIGYAEVDTLRLAGQAVTIPVSAYGPTSLHVNAGWTELAAVGIQSTGAKIFVHCSGMMYLWSFQYYGNSFRMRVVRNGVEIFHEAVCGLVSVGQSIQQAISASISDTPGAGWIVYSFQGRVFRDQSSVTGGDCSHRSILALEAKR